MEVKDKFELAFNLLNGAMICVAISIAGLGIFILQTEIPGVTASAETAFKCQGLLAGILGACVSFLAWIGTFGVNNENPKLMSAFLFIFGSLVIPTLVLGIMIFVFIFKWKAATDGDIFRHMDKYYESSSSAKITDAIQLGFECCGMEEMPSSYSGMNLPVSCCDPMRFKAHNTTEYCLPEYKFKRNCNGVLTEHIEQFLICLGSLTLLLALFFVGLIVIVALIRRWFIKPAKMSKQETPAKNQPSPSAKNESLQRKKPGGKGSNISVTGPVPS